MDLRLYKTYWHNLAMKIRFTFFINYPKLIRFHIKLDICLRQSSHSADIYALCKSLCIYIVPSRQMLSHVRKSSILPLSYTVGPSEILLEHS